MVFNNIIKVNVYGESLLLGSLYRSPISDFNSFFDHFKEWEKEAFTQNVKCIIIGDFNLNLLDKNSDE